MAGVTTMPEVTAAMVRTPALLQLPEEMRYKIYEEIVARYSWARRQPGLRVDLDPWSGGRWPMSNNIGTDVLRRWYCMIEDVGLTSKALHDDFGTWVFSRITFVSTSPAHMLVLMRGYDRVRMCQSMSLLMRQARGLDVSGVPEYRKRKTGLRFLPNRQMMGGSESFLRLAAMMTNLSVMFLPQIELNANPAHTGSRFRIADLRIFKALLDSHVNLEFMAYWQDATPAGEYKAWPQFLRERHWSAKPHHNTRPLIKLDVDLELNNYLAKHAQRKPDKVRKRMKKNPFAKKKKRT